MRKGWIAAGAAAGILIALLSMALPVGRLLGIHRENRQLIESLENRAGQMSEAQKAREWNLAKWYNHNLARQGRKAGENGYDTILDLYQGTMGVLEIPGEELPIAHGPAPLPGGAAHDPDSPLPLGTAGSHTVLHLGKDPALEPGEVVRVRCLGLAVSYRVESVQVMPEGWSTDLLCLGRKGYLTLVVDKGNTRTLIRCVEISENP